VIDKNSKQPIPYVNVSVLENAKIITGGITQENGNFTIKNLSLKKYTVEVQFIGYKKITQAFFLLFSLIRLGATKCAPARLPWPWPCRRAMRGSCPALRPFSMATARRWSSRSTS
jgi:hypothetical protein